jgi:hypothetical protein
LRTVAHNKKPIPRLSVVSFRNFSSAYSFEYSSVSDSLACPKATLNEIFGCSVLAQPRCPKTSERVQPLLLDSEFFQQRMQLTAEDIRLQHRLALAVRKDKAALAVAEILFQKRSDGNRNADGNLLCVL